MYQRAVVGTFDGENGTEEEIVNLALFDTALVTALQDDRRSVAELHRSAVDQQPTTSILARSRWQRFLSAGRAATREPAPATAMVQTPQGAHPA